MAKKERIVSCIDIGTAKVGVIVGRSVEDNRLEILGAGYAPSAGFIRGVVVDLDAAADVLRQAAQEAEARTDAAIDWVTVGIAGDHVQGVNCHGAISIEGRSNEVTSQDIAQVTAAAQSIPLPPSREIIHVLPQQYYLDNRGEIRNPLGLSGSRLAVDLHVVTAESAQLQNLVNVVNRAQMRVRRVILHQLASAEAVLTADEKDLGCAVVDIGAGTTDIAVFQRNAVSFSALVPVAGAHFTRDLAVGLRTPIEAAERIKHECGNVLLDGIAEDEIIDVPGVGSRAARPMTRRFACEILHHRACELIEMIRDQLLRAGERDQLMAGVVLTGAGSNLGGLVELAERMLEVPVRQGLPVGASGISEELAHPAYSTIVGLALLSVRESELYPVRLGKTSPSPSFVNRILSWVGS